MSGKILGMKQPQIGMLIRELGLETGLTKEQFAAELGVTCSSINRWENERSKPLPLARQKIFQCLGKMDELPDATLRERGQELLAKYVAN